MINSRIKGETKNKKFTYYDRHFLKIIVSTGFQTDLHAFKINSSDILIHSSSMAVLSEPIFGSEVAFVFFFFFFFSKTPCIA